MWYAKTMSLPFITESDAEEFGSLLAADANALLNLRDGIKVTHWSITGPEYAWVHPNTEAPDNVGNMPKKLANWADTAAERASIYGAYTPLTYPVPGVAPLDVSGFGDKDHHWSALDDYVTQILAYLTDRATDSRDVGYQSELQGWVFTIGEYLLFIRKSIGRA